MNNSLPSVKQLEFVVAQPPELEQYHDQVQALRQHYELGEMSNGILSLSTCHETLVGIASTRNIRLNGPCVFVNELYLADTMVDRKLGGPLLGFALNQHPKAHTVRLIPTQLSRSFYGRLGFTEVGRAMEAPLATVFDRLSAPQ